MKQYIILLAAAFLFTGVRAQQLISSEYFFDSDPGVGNGTALIVTPGDSILFSGNISTTGLSNGFHFLYIRSKNTNNKWGLSERRMVYIEPVIISSAAPLSQAEYFVDTDPGVGNGTALTVAGGDSILFSGAVPTTSLNTGFHFLYTRTQGTNGKWGIAERRMFYIETPPLLNPPNLLAAEFFVNVDPGFGNATPIAVSGSDSIVFNGVLAITDTALGFDSLYIRVKDLSGVWSLYEPRGFQITPDASVNEISGDPAVLFQNYPNPFSNSTVIEFHLSKPGDATIYITDFLGREVQRIESKNLSPGNHAVTFDSSGLTDGYYFYKLVAGDFTETKKMSLLKH